MSDRARDLTRNRIYMLETTLDYIRSRADRPDFIFMDVWNPVNMNLMNEGFVLEHGAPPKGKAMASYEIGSGGEIPPEEQATPPKAPAPKAPKNPFGSDVY